ncbi:hypothetical protein AXF42_Ash005031 [Apostasia shenzhenica]|uniref:Uncharacterized protein n=1 Tax=Apostasia shenzhenica TaxID=1088818 RepID=A0A2I0B8B2_9ASPA|nr:hypothetical protein AXF42_Ash005031 [Apostasia shenzhenica]
MDFAFDREEEEEEHRVPAGGCMASTASFHKLLRPMRTPRRRSQRANAMSYCVGCTDGTFCSLCLPFHHERKAIRQRWEGEFICGLTMRLFSLVKLSC